MVSVAGRAQRALANDASKTAQNRFCTPRLRASACKKCFCAAARTSSAITLRVTAAAGASAAAAPASDH
jgi:hypothetical protein